VVAIKKTRENRRVRGRAREGEKKKKECIIFTAKEKSSNCQNK